MATYGYQQRRRSRWRVFWILVVLAFGFGGGVKWVYHTVEFYRASRTDTFEAYQAFVKKHKDARQDGDATVRAARFVRAGEHLKDWPAFLAELGAHTTAHSAQALAAELAHPQTHVRRAAARSLRLLSEPFAADVRGAVGHPAALIDRLRLETDAKVRLDLRCTLWNIERAEGVPASGPPSTHGITELSPYVRDGLTAYIASRRAAVH